MDGLREVIENKGLFCALYSDRGSHFFVTPKAGDKVDKHRPTQVGRALKELGVQMIAAYSPQARGRSERSFGTWQGRLPQELRLAGITTLQDANEFLRQQYIAVFNQKFTVAAAEKGTAFRRTTRRTWTGSSPCKPSAWWPRTTRSQLQIGTGSWRRAGFAVRWPAARSPSRIIWMGPCRSGTDRMWSAATRPPERFDQPPPTRKRRAVEKAGLWKPWKTKCRFSLRSHRPLEIPHGGIPTFPPRRLRFPSPRLRPRKPPSASRRGSSREQLPDADTSRVNKSGQVDVLTTPFN